MSSQGNAEDQNNSTKYKGIRRRKWGKWVSEIRVPGSQSRLWLGSYATPEAAAVAHDVAFYCLKRPTTLDSLNFPHTLPISALSGEMSPSSVQRAASDAGLAVDAQFAGGQFASPTEEAGQGNGVVYGDENDVSWISTEAWNISVEDYL